MSTATKRGSYPHPVLDGSDDVSSAFDVFNVTVSPSVDDVELRFQVRMDDPDLLRFIEDGKARFSFRWKCGSTLSSEELEPKQSVLAGSTSFTAWIPQELIRRSVRVEIKVVAVSSLTGYTLTRQHEDYAGATFDIASGDVLADGGHFTFEANKLYDPLNPPVGSCFQFQADQTLRRGIKIGWDDDEYVIVKFPPEVLVGLAALTSRPDLQISLVVLPALMSTIEFIKENEDPSTGEDLSDRLWYQAISKLIRENGSLDDQTFVLAQKILSNPLDLSLMTSLNTDEDDE